MFEDTPASRRLISLALLASKIKQINNVVDDIQEHEEYSSETKAILQQVIDNKDTLVTNMLQLLRSITKDYLRIFENPL